MERMESSVIRKTGYIILCKELYKSCISTLGGYGNGVLSEIVGLAISYTLSWE